MIIWGCLGGALYFFVMGFTANIFYSQSGDSDQPIWLGVLQTILWPWPWVQLVIELIIQSHQIRKSAAEYEEERKKVDRSV